ncbi:MAG: nuclear transport factor 2 family protein [Myxococcales bacterium]|nr:nuclear transport factor 2 family protein [Myxococcales bacterium]
MADATTDELEIRDLVARYADAVNTRDEVAWGDTWTSGGVWELMGHAFEGREAVVATWRGAMTTFEFVFQQVHSGFVELDGDRAIGRWAMTEIGRTSAGDPMLMLARYEDEYAREAEGWRFAKRSLQVVYRGAPDLRTSEA